MTTTRAHTDILFEVNNSFQSNILIIGNEIVKIDMKTGQVIFGKNYNADEASKIFWKNLGRSCPAIKKD